jgi:hypothetical protein
MLHNIYFNCLTEVGVFFGRRLKKWQIFFLYSALARISYIMGANLKNNFIN